MFIIHPDFRKSKCLQIFHRQSPAGETIHHTANFQIASLENFSYRKSGFNIFNHFSLTFKFFPRDKCLFFSYRIPTEDLFIVISINAGWSLRFFWNSCMGLSSCSSTETLVVRPRILTVSSCVASIFSLSG